MALTSQELVQGILKQDLAVLARAITTIEGQTLKQQETALEVLEQLAPEVAQFDSLRMGISGVPGVGKSSFIEAFGQKLIERRGKLAVLAVDPSSVVSGGSILGDKTRMGNLSLNPHSLIRPSPSIGALGGVGPKTRESIFLCEAAKFKTILVETVGVGQSEVMVAGMVDLFILLVIPGAGDELQGIKRGILELADLVIVHKADGDMKMRAQLCQKELSLSLHILRGEKAPPVLTLSSHTLEGMDELLRTLDETCQKLSTSGEFQTRRNNQNKKWMQELLEYCFYQRFLKSLKDSGDYSRWEEKVLRGEANAPTAAKKLLGQGISFLEGKPKSAN